MSYGLFKKTKDDENQEIDKISLRWFVSTFCVTMARQQKQPTNQCSEMNKRLCHSTIPSQTMAICFYIHPDRRSNQTFSTFVWLVIGILLSLMEFYFFFGSRYFHSLFCQDILFSHSVCFFLHIFFTFYWFRYSMLFSSFCFNLFSSFQSCWFQPFLELFCGLLVYIYMTITIW